MRSPFRPLAVRHSTATILKAAMASTKVLPPLVQNTKRPADWKTLAPGPPISTTTFSRQGDLPKLPVPELNSTLDKLKRSLQPLAHSRDEWELAVKRIDEFGRPGGAGRILHNRLKDRKDQEGMSHWLEEFWDDAAYLKYRDTVVTNVSYYYGFSSHPAHLPQGPLARAAAIIRSTFLYRKNLKQGNLAVDMQKADPLCMDTYRWMFDCSRIPGLEGADWGVSASKEGDDGSSGHVVVLRKGRFWKLDIVAKGEKRLLSTAEIEGQIRTIYDSTAQNYPDVGLLTASDRDTWAKDYAILASSPHNATILHEVHSAAFILCLDSSSPGNILEMSRALFHGGVHGEELGNRWLDKPVQFIVFENGEAGCMGEHSVMDGTPTVSLYDTVLDSLCKEDFDHGGVYPSEAVTSSAVPQPLALDWEITPAIEASIENARNGATVIIDRQDMNRFVTDYGRDAVKGWGVSPDAWAQMMIQLAYHRLKGGYKRGRERPGATYEAGSTRKFLKGRTEAIRVVTNESMDWCDAMTESTGKFSDGEKILLFKEAVKRHVVNATEAGNASGIDRHMFGMKHMLLRGEKLPELFTDPLYSRACTWVLSTSAIFSPHFTKGYGWGQVVENGFGVAYMTGFADRLEFTVTSRKSEPNARFVEELRRASEEMKDLLSEPSDTTLLKSKL